MKYYRDNTGKSINNNINVLFEKLIDKYYKQDAKLDKKYETLESINAHIENHNSQIDKIIKTQLHPFKSISQKFHPNYQLMKPA